MGLQIVPPLQLAVSTLMFVLNVWRVPFDVEFLYTGSASFRVWYGGTGLFGGVALSHGSSTEDLREDQREAGKQIEQIE
jgi:hypothetical protein